MKALPKKIQTALIFFCALFCIANDANCQDNTLTLKDISGCASFLTDIGSESPDELPIKSGDALYYPSVGFSANKPRFDELYLDLTVLQSQQEIFAAARALAATKSYDHVLDAISEAKARGISQLPLSPFLPEVVALKEGADPNYWDGNCFNATLKWHNSAVGIQHASTQEIDEALANHFILLGPEDKLRLGDVISFCSYEGKRGGFHNPWSPENTSGKWVSTVHTAYILIANSFGTRRACGHLIPGHSKP